MNDVSHWEIFILLSTTKYVASRSTDLCGHWILSAAHVHSNTVIALASLLFSWLMYRQCTKYSPQPLTHKIIALVSVSTISARQKLRPIQYSAPPDCDVQLSQQAHRSLSSKAPVNRAMDYFGLKYCHTMERASSCNNDYLFCS